MRKHGPWHFAWLAMSALLSLWMLYCYQWRADAVAAITVFPAWLWLLPGLFLLALSLHRHGAWIYRYSLIAAASLWLIFTIAFVEEPQSIIRAALWHTPQKTTHTLRVITLNCAGGSVAAAAEVKRLQPDIVLWQEIPNSKDVVKLAKQIFGPHANVAMGLDTAIAARTSAARGSAARSSVEQMQVPHDMQRYFAQARVHLSNRTTIEVVSLHLMSPPFRLDLWSPDCWNAQRTNRQIQREQMESIVKQLSKTPSTVPIIIGGDFNMPQGDAVSRLLQSRFRDSFRESGRGWGDTITNQYPVLRIDQIWMSRQFEAMDVRAHRTRYSDHRMVVCDLELQ